MKTLRFSCCAVALLALVSDAMGARFQRDESAYFATPDQIALHAHGWTLDYRFRRVQMQDGSDARLPRLVVDGVVRLKFDADGIWTDETFLEMLDEEGHRSSPRRTRTFHSLSSGLYARCFAVAGGPTETAIVESWSGLPKLVFFGLGFAEGKAVLRRATPAGRERVSEHVDRASFVTPEGKRWSIDYSSSGVGALHRIVGTSSSDDWTDWIVFEGHVEGPPGLPLRPTRICDTRIGADGRVAYVSIWQAIERLDEPRTDDFTVAPMTTVADFRSERPDAAPRSTDRALELHELIDWAGALAEPYTDPPVELSGADIAARIEKDRRQGLRAKAGWALVFVAAALGVAAFARRNRT